MESSDGSGSDRISSRHDIRSHPIIPQEGQNMSRAPCTRALVIAVRCRVPVQCLTSNKYSLRSIADKPWRFTNCPRRCYPAVCRER